MWTQLRTELDIYSLPGKSVSSSPYELWICEVIELYVCQSTALFLGWTVTGSFDWIFHDQCLACVLMRFWQSCYEPGHTSRGNRKVNAAQVLFVSFSKIAWILSIAKWQALISVHLIVVYLRTQNLLSICFLSTFWMVARFECTWKCVLPLALCRWEAYTNS